MDEVQDNTPSQKPKKAKRMITIKMSARTLSILLVVLAIIISFFIGKNYGEKHASPSSKLSNAARNATGANSNRWTAVGNITEVSETHIKVKDSRGETKEGDIAKDVSITDRTGKKLTPKDLKKDMRVIVSGTKDGNKQTVTRIRVLK